MRNIETYMYPGMWVNLDNIKESNVSIETIAHSLSLQCRYTGHTRRMYSVAEHSLYVAEALGSLYDRLTEIHQSDPSADTPPSLLEYSRAEWQLSGLCHDFTEAFVGDVAEPVKETLPEYKLLEDYVEEQLTTMFGYPSLPWTHMVDKMLPIIEMNVLVLALKHRQTTASLPDYPYVSEIMAACGELRVKLEVGMTSAEAKEELIRKYEQLWNEITNSST